MSTWLDRYLRGDRVQVWTEINGLGPSIRQDPDALAEAERVGRETMRRARSNAEHLIDHLPAIGYTLTPGEGLVTFEPPEARVTDRLDEIESRVGPLPLTWRWWSEEVGRVNPMGNHLDWNCDYPDPLVVDAPPDYVDGEIDVWEEDSGTEWDTGARFSIDFSPDHLHKANISGGAPHALELPNEAADGLVLWERHNTTFVNYLRIAFTNGRLPRVECRTLPRCTSRRPGSVVRGAAAPVGRIRAYIVPRTWENRGRERGPAVRPQSPENRQLPGETLVSRRSRRPSPVASQAENARSILVTRPRLGLQACISKFRTQDLADNLENPSWAGLTKP